MLKIGQRKAAGLSDGHANKNQASDRELFGAIRDELDARTAGTAVQVDAVDLPTAIALVNELKGLNNAAAGASKLFEK